MPGADIEAQAREWVRFADDDLTLARAGLTRHKVFKPRQVCFHAQQACEKAIKALLVAAQIEFRFTHDLEQLAQALPRSRSLPVKTSDLAWLGQWATATRYPGGDEPSWSEGRRAVEIAETLVFDVRAGLGRGGGA
jgi:HEPN domain-containing protein